MFKCDQCGYCCENLSTNEIYADLNRGDGVCKYFDQKIRLCLIYENRPAKCRIDHMFEVYFKYSMTLTEYYELNYGACEQLKQQRRK